MLCIGRLTAPVAGEDRSAEDLKQDAKAKADSAADTLQEKGNEAADQTRSTYGKVKSSIGNFFGGAQKHGDASG